MLMTMTAKEFDMLRKFKKIADNYEGAGFRSIIWTELLTESRSDSAVFGSLIAKDILQHEAASTDDRCWINRNYVDEISAIFAEQDADDENEGLEAFLAEEWTPIEYDPAEDYAKYGRKW